MSSVLLSFSKGNGLRARVVRAASWTLAAYIVCQGIRFGSNLVMTRLLFPEAFGIMTIVTLVMIGVALLTDIGVTQSIISDPEGDKREFLNTAWTVQLLRGIVIGGLIAAAARPVALFYKQPLLEDFLYLTACTSAFAGLQSTKIATASREINAARLALLEIGGSAINVIVAMLYALYEPTAWALIWGNVASSVARTLATHYLFPGENNRVHWNPVIARRLMHFGLWITLSSALTFLSGEGARLLMGKLLDVRLLAMNSLAGALCWTVAGVIQSMAGRVFHPVYAEVLRASPERFAEVVHKSRRVQVAAVWGSCLFFLLLGKPLIDFLYDKRYADAAVMLQIQSLGLMIGVLSTSYSSVLLSMGRMGLGSVIQFCQIIVNISFMLVGHHVAGPFGVVAFGTLSGWALYPVTAFIYKKLGLWKASIDLPVLLATLLASLLYAYSEQWRPALAW